MGLKANLETRDEKNKDKAHRNYERRLDDDTYLEPDMKKRQKNNEKKISRI